VISQLPAANLAVPYGSNVALSVQTLKTDGCPFTESHTWTFRGEYAGSGPTCTVSSASAAAEGMYVDSITNAAGGAKVAFQLSVIGEGSPVWWGGLLPAEWERFARLHDTIALAGSFHHNLLLRENGTVLAWGDNQWGATNVPAGLTDVVAIAAGDDHSLGLRADGTVVAWGRNNYGQCSVPNVSNTQSRLAETWG
jgi:hypothetical protein